MSFRRLLLVGLTALLTTMSSAEAPRTLNLAERRAIKAYQETRLPDLVKAIQVGARFEVPVEVQWEAIALPEMAPRYHEDEFWTVIFFTPLAQALKTITADDMGRDALKGALKKVVITYDDKTAPASNYVNGVTFKDGTLTLNFTPFSNSGDVEERAKAIVSVLEKAL